MTDRRNGSSSHRWDALAISGLRARQTRAGARRDELRRLILRVPKMPRWSTVYAVDSQWNWLPSANRFAAALAAQHDGEAPYAAGWRTVLRDLHAVWYGDAAWRAKANRVRPSCPDIDSFCGVLGGFAAERLYEARVDEALGLK